MVGLLIWKCLFEDLVWFILHLTFYFFFPLLLQTLSFYFPPCGKIPPPVIMVQNVSFKYSDNTVSTFPAARSLDYCYVPQSLTQVFLLSTASHIQKPGVWDWLGYTGRPGGAQRSGKIDATEAADGRGQWNPPDPRPTFLGLSSPVCSFQS